MGFLGLLRDGRPDPAAPARPCQVARAEPNIRVRILSEHAMSHIRIAYDTFQKTAPAARDALLAMGKTADELGVDKADRRAGEAARVADQQLRLLPADPSQRRRASSACRRRSSTWSATWHEAGIFSARECAALAWAEALTHLAGRSVPDEAYDAVRRAFQRGRGGVPVSVAIATINAWNRLGAAFRFAPPIAEEGGGGGSRVRVRSSVPDGSVRGGDAVSMPPSYLPPGGGEEHEGRLSQSQRLRRR